MDKKNLSAKDFIKLVNALQSGVKRVMAEEKKLQTAPAPTSLQAQKIDEQQLESMQTTIELETKQKESLDKLGEQIAAVERAILGIGKKFDKLPRELAREGKDFSKIEIKKDATVKEALSELVGEFKSVFGSVGRGLKSTFAFGKEPISGTKSGVRKAGTYITDVLGAEAGFTAEADRFAIERIKQENAKRNQLGKKPLTDQEESVLKKESRQKFREIVSKEREITDIESRIEESKSYGFTPVLSDIEEKNRLITEIREQKRSVGITDFSPVEKKTKKEKSEKNRPVYFPLASGKSSTGTTGTSSTPVFDPELRVQSGILQKSLQELSLIRKISEGSLEYDRKAAQYRNTSGRKIISKVTGKDIVPGSFVDFETASDRLTGQSKRVIEAETKVVSAKPVPVTQTKIEPTESALTTQTGIEPVKSESGPVLPIPNVQVNDEGNKPVLTTQTGIEPEESNRSRLEPVKPVSEVQVRAQTINPESDNVQTSQEILAENSKITVEVAKESNQIFKDQLFELRQIKEALSGGSAVLPSQSKSKVTGTESPVSSPEPEGISLPDINLGLPTGSVPGKKVPGKGGKILGTLGKAARFLGPVAAVAAAAGTAYSGYEGLQNTEKNFDLEEGKQATLGQKISSTLGGAASGLTFGLVDEKTAAQNIHKMGSKIGEFFGFGDKDKSVKPVPTAPAGSELVGVRNPSTGQQLTQSSTENIDLSRGIGTQSTPPPIISSSVNNNNTTSYVPIKPSPRPEYTGSALDRYTAGISVY